MIKKETVLKLKDKLILVIIGAALSVIPFYFETKAMTTENNLVNQKQDQKLEVHENILNQNAINAAVEKTESKQIKETLKRIEVKLDRLIEKELSSVD